MPAASPEKIEDIRKLAHNTLLEEELLTVLRTLEQRQIEAVVLKGLPLLSRLGASLETRRLADNDILVRRTDARLASEALSSLGYRAPALRSLDADLKSDFQHPLVRLRPRGAPYIVELHWNAFPPYLCVDEAILWENRSRARLRDLEISVLNVELSLIHLASHHVQHLGLESRILEDFAHAYETWKGELNSQHLGALMTATRTYDIVTYCLHLAWNRRLLAVIPTLPLSRRGQSMLKWLPGPLATEAPHAEAYRRSLLVWWFVARGSILKLILAHTFPPISKMAQRHQETRASRLLLYYLGRPLRPLRRIAARFVKNRLAARNALRTSGPVR